jgi:5'-3' exonuclease
MKALIDADIIAFSCAAFNEAFGWDSVVQDIDDMMNRILETTEADSFQAYITGQNNYRYVIDPEYKANRKGKEPPQYRQDANAYMVTRWGAQVTDGIEADDAMGIAQSQAEPLSTIICTIDKDLKQISGRHYNWRKDEFDMVSPIDGIRLFYRQCITGDRTDNIFGIAGLGPVKSARLINDVEDEWDMFEIVRALYNDDDRLLKNGKLLHIHQKDNDWWKFPDAPNGRDYEIIGDTGG